VITPPATNTTAESHPQAAVATGSEPQAAVANDSARLAQPPHPRAFKALELTSFGHSCIYLGLLVCAFALGKPEPATFILGLTHGLLWIAMSLACILATRLRIVPLRLAVAVAVLGGIGPFFGSAEFIRAQRRRTQQAIL
jgi:hypothetical protein